MKSIYVQQTTKTDLQKTVKLCRGRDKQGFQVYNELFAIELRDKMSILYLIYSYQIVMNKKRSTEVFDWEGRQNRLYFFSR